MIVIMTMRVAVFLALRMVMIVVVAVAVAVMMFVTMRMIVMVAVMVMILTGYGTDAAFRFERCFDRLDLRSEGVQRLLERRIAAQTHAIFLYLNRYVTVAEVPRQSRERRGIVDAHFEEPFSFRDDFHNAAIVEQQRVVGAKSHGLAKIKFDAGAFHAEQKSALRLALRERKYERVDDTAGLAIG
jgi:hypothetical protein